MKKFALFLLATAMAIGAALLACKSGPKLPPTPLGQIASTAGASNALTILGCQRVNAVGAMPFSTTMQCEQGTDWLGGDAGAPTVVGLPSGSSAYVWTYDLAPGDSDHFNVDVDVAGIGASSVYSADHAQFTLAWGPTLNPDGGASDPSNSGPRVTFSDIGGNMTGTTAVLVQTGISIGLYVTCTTSDVYCTVRSSASISVGNQPLAVLAVSPSSLSAAVANTTTITITTTSGAGQFVTGANLGALNLTGCTSVSPFTTTTCNLLPGTYTVGTSNVGIATAYTNPIALPSGFTFTTPTDAGGVDAGVDAGQDSGTDSGGGGGGPTLSAINFSSGTAPCVMGPLGGVACTLQGTSLAGVSAVTLSGTGCTGSATSLSSTSTSVTFTPPSGQTNDSLCTVTATVTAGTTNALTSAVRILASNSATGAGAVIASTGFASPNWQDIINANTFVTGSGTLTSTSSFLNGQPAIVFNGSSDTADTAFTTMNQPWHGCVVATSSVAGSQTQAVFLDTANNTGLGVNPAGSICSCAGGAFDPCATASMASAHLYCFDVNGASTTLWIDGVNSGTGTGSGAFTASRFDIGRSVAGGLNRLTGDVLFVHWTVGTDTGNADKVFDHVHIAQDVYGLP